MTEQDILIVRQDGGSEFFCDNSSPMFNPAMCSLIDKFHGKGQVIQINSFAFFGVPLKKFK